MCVGILNFLSLHTCAQGKESLRYFIPEEQKEVVHASPSVCLTREENASILSMSVNEKWLVVMAGKNNRGNEFFLSFHLTLF